jgi:hypothetical protein
MDRSQSIIVLSPVEVSPTMDPAALLIKLKNDKPQLGARTFSEVTNVGLSSNLNQQTKGIKRCFESFLTVCTNVDADRVLPLKKRKLTSLKTITPEQPLFHSSNDKVVTPKAVLEEILRDAGFTPRFRTARSLQEQGGYFLDMTDSNIASYKGDTVTALREKDISKLLEIHKADPSCGLQCCNQFGESLIHMSCRRGYAEVTECLLKEGRVNPRVTDDYGRTPMHDACWTTVPNEDLMKLLFTEAHDLLLVKDSRGHTPLDYVSRRHWKQWVDFLRANEASLSPNCQMKKYFQAEA